MTSTKIDAGTAADSDDSGLVGEIVVPLEDAQPDRTEVAQGGGDVEVDYVFLLPMYERVVTLGLKMATLVSKACTAVNLLVVEHLKASTIAAALQTAVEFAQKSVAIWVDLCAFVDRFETVLVRGSTETAGGGGVDAPTLQSVLAETLPMGKQFRLHSGSVPTDVLVGRSRRHIGNGNVVLRQHLPLLLHHVGDIGHQVSKGISGVLVSRCQHELHTLLVALVCMCNTVFHTDSASNSSSAPARPTNSTAGSENAGTETVPLWCELLAAVASGDEVLPLIFRGVYEILVGPDATEKTAAAATTTTTTTTDVSIATADTPGTSSFRLAELLQSFLHSHGVAPSVITSDSSDCSKIEPSDEAVEFEILCIYCCCHLFAGFYYTVNSDSESGGCLDTDTVPLGTTKGGEGRTRSLYPQLRLPAHELLQGSLRKVADSCCKIAQKCIQSVSAFAHAHASGTGAGGGAGMGMGSASPLPSPSRGTATEATLLGPALLYRCYQLLVYGSLLFDIVEDVDNTAIAYCNVCSLLRLYVSVEAPISVAVAVSMDVGMDVQLFNRLCSIGSSGGHSHSHSNNHSRRAELRAYYKRHPHHLHLRTKTNPNPNTSFSNSGGGFVNMFAILPTVPRAIGDAGIGTSAGGSNSTVAGAVIACNAGLVRRWYSRQRGSSGGSFATPQAANALLYWKLSLLELAKQYADFGMQLLICHNASITNNSGKGGDAGTIDPVLLKNLTWGQISTELGHAYLASAVLKRTHEFGVGTGQQTQDGAPLSHDGSSNSVGTGPSYGPVGRTSTTGSLPSLGHTVTQIEEDLKLALKHSTTSARQQALCRYQLGALFFSAYRREQKILWEGSSSAVRSGATAAGVDSDSTGGRVLAQLASQGSMLEYKKLALRNYEQAYQFYVSNDVSPRPSNPYLLALVDIVDIYLDSPDYSLAPPTALSSPSSANQNIYSTEILARAMSYVLDSRFAFAANTLHSLKVAEQPGPFLTAVVGRLTVYLSQILFHALKHAKGILPVDAGGEHPVSSSTSAFATELRQLYVQVCRHMRAGSADVDSLTPSQLRTILETLLRNDLLLSWLNIKA